MTHVLGPFNKKRIEKHHVVQWTSVKQTYQFIYNPVFDTSMCQCLFKQ